MTPEERKKAYEGSALQALMDASGHEICKRCYCCDVESENETCWACGGFDDYEDDPWGNDPCSVCGGEGEIFWRECIGRCDEQGNHKVSVFEAEKDLERRT